MRELTQIELEQLNEAGITIDELESQWDLFPEQDFVTAVGAVVMLKQGLGQERNEPFMGEDTAGVMGE